MTAYVVDASVAVKWLIYEQSSDQAVAFARSNNRFITPRIIMTEVANALARKSIQGVISSAEAKQQFTKLSYFFDEVVDVDDLIPIALENACRFRHPIYDLIYLEAAGRSSAQLITADLRFGAKLAGTDLAHHVTLLSDWQPE